MILLGYISAVLIGVCLGLIGGGGSILTIPVLVYLFHFAPDSATVYSLFIVCIASFVGSIEYLKRGQICYRSIVVFGLPSLISVYITRKFIFPAIPNHVELTNGFMMHKDSFLMLLVSVLMFISAISLIRRPRIIRPDNFVDTEQYRFIPTVLGGLVVGFLSGLIGTGGGFLIIPALLIFARLGMKTAIGTSLIIITTNTAIGFLSDLHAASEINWKFLALFTALSVAGILTGTYISKYISGYKLKTAFGWFIFAIATFIITKYLVVSL